MSITEKEFTIGKKLNECLKTLQEDLCNGDLPLNQIISDFREVLTDHHKEFIERLKKKINNKLKDKLNPIDYTTSRRREFNNNLEKIKKDLDELAGKELIQ